MLKRGQQFKLDGQPWRVAYVNECRAHCVGTDKRLVTVHDARTGRDRTFTAASARTLDISPNAEVDERVYVS